MSNLIEDLGFTAVENEKIEQTITEKVSDNTTTVVNDSVNQNGLNNPSNDDDVNLIETEVENNLSLEKENKREGVNNNTQTEDSINDEKVLAYLKEKGIDIDSLNTIKSTQEDEDIQLFKKYKEISKNGNVEEFMYAKEIAKKDWSKVDKPDLVAKYLSEVEDLQDNHVTRKLKKLAPTPILSEEEFMEEDFNGDYDQYVEAVKDQNIDKEIEFNALYKQSIKHYTSETGKYKDLFKAEVSANKDNLDDYFVGLAKSIDSIDDLKINETKVVYTKEDKDFMLKNAQQINDLPSKYFNTDGTAIDSKKVLQDFVWLDSNFREKKQKEIWQVAFNAGKEAMIKNKANITLDTNNQNTINTGAINFEDIIKKSLGNY